MQNTDLEGFEGILHDSKSILWTGRPEFTPYFIRGIIPELFLFFIGILSIIFNLLLHHNIESWFGSLWLFDLPVVLYGLYTITKKALFYPKALYGFTDKRVLIRSGWLGTDFQFIDYPKIIDITVTTNLIEDIYRVGTLKFDSGKTVIVEDDLSSKIIPAYDFWIGIPEPYEIFERVKQHLT